MSRAVRARCEFLSKYRARARTGTEEAHRISGPRGHWRLEGALDMVSECFETAIKKGAQAETCFDCGLPSDCTERRGCCIVLRVRPENGFRREQHRRVWCCSEECARHAAFLQLEARSTRDTITRLFGGKSISYSEFLRLPLELVKRGSERYEIPSEVIDSINPKTAKNEVMALPHAGPSFVTRGRPRTHPTAAARQRAYRDRQRKQQRQSVIA